MTTIYVIRSFGSVLIVQSTQQATSLPTVLIAAHTRDGTVKTATHDGIAATSTRDGITPARTP